MGISITPKQILERSSRRVALKPGLSEEEIQQIAKRLPGGIPHDITELLRYSAGFDIQLDLPHAAAGTVRFEGTQSLGFPGEALSSPIDLLDDGCGNFWLVDIEKPTGEWGSVFFVCHDPPVIVIQALDLGTFLSQVLDPRESNPKDALTYVRKEAVTRIWRDDPWLISVREARASPDPTVSNFAEKLPEVFHLADLRSREVGSGFSWDLVGPHSEVLRAPGELLFGVQSKVPGFFERLMTGRGAHPRTSERPRDQRH